MIDGVVAEFEQLAQLWIFDRAREDIRKAVVHHICDIDADRKEGYEFDDGLECDRSNQSFMPFGGVKVARAEENREQSQQQCDVEGIVGEQRRRRWICSG